MWHPLKNMTGSACVYMVVAVAAERYYAICYPMRRKPGPYFYFTAVMLLSLLINMPKFFEFKHLTAGAGQDNNTLLYYWTTDLNEDPTYVVFNSYHEVAVVGFIPLLALCYMNYMIYVKIKKSSLLKNR